MSDTDTDILACPKCEDANLEPVTASDWLRGILAIADSSTQSSAQLALSPSTPP